MRRMTTRCHAYGHPEFILEVARSILAEDSDWLIQYLENSVARGEVFRAGETLQTGWMINSFRECSEGLMVFEPDMIARPIRFVNSVTRTLTHLRLQKDVAESVGLEDCLLFPSIRQSAIACKAWGEVESFSLSRFDPEGADSGWFVGCLMDHDHDAPENLERVSLYDIGSTHSILVQFLALPPGVSLLLENEDVSFLKNGEPLPIREGTLLSRFS